MKIDTIFHDGRMVRVATWRENRVIGRDTQSVIELLMSVIGLQANFNLL